MFKRAAVGLLSLYITLPLLAKDSEKDKAHAGVAHGAGPVHLTPEGEKWAQKTLSRLTTEEKVGQLLMVRAFAEFDNAQAPNFQAIKDELSRYHLGSVILTVRVDNGILMKSPPYEAAMMTNALQRASALPLLVAADFERGASMRLASTPAFPAAMAFGATNKPEYNRRFAQIAGRESRALGVHWNFFPVADVNSNPLNPIINVRAYGEDPKQVGDFVEAYIQGSQQEGMLTTAKHFPGHGDTDRDTHVEFARVNGDLARLKAVELEPFQRAINAGVDSVMVAHVTAPALEPLPLPATLSHKIIAELLKDQMHFQGIVVTDAMEMGALINAYKTGPTIEAHELAGRAAVDAVKAGNDMVLLPSDIEGAYNGLLGAAQSGKISGEELDERVLKVLRAKASVGLHKSRLVDVDAISDLVGRPDDMAFAQQVADESVTLVRDNHQALAAVRAQRGRGNPGTSTSEAAYTTPETAQAAAAGLVAVILTEDLRSDWGRVFEAEFRSRAPGARIFAVDADVSGAMLPEIADAVANAHAVVLAAYSVPISGKVVGTATGFHNTVALTGGNAAVVDRVLKTAGEKTVMIALGNPYLALDFPAVSTYLCTFSNTGTSERAAVKAVFGDIPMQGHLPVSLPGIAERGTGLASAARRVRLRPAKYIRAVH